MQLLQLSSRGEKYKFLNSTKRKSLFDEKKIVKIEKVYAPYYSLLAFFSLQMLKQIEKQTAV